MRFYEVVTKKYDPELRQRVLAFPETLPCPKCGAPRGVELGLPEGSTIDDPHLALQIRLVEFGYSGGFKDPSVPEPQPCCQLGDLAPTSVRSALDLTKDGWGLFPTLTVCSGCGGHKGHMRGKTVEDPGLSWRIALVQFGHSTCRHYDNEPPSHACNCESRLAQLEVEIAKLPLVKDGGWGRAGGLPHRGITDYARTMEFSRDLTQEELGLLREWLQRKDCPGWTGVRAAHYSEGQYGFTTTWDSSD